MILIEIRHAVTHQSHTHSFRKPANEQIVRAVLNLAVEKGVVTADAASCREIGEGVRSQQASMKTKMKLGRLLNRFARREKTFPKLGVVAKCCTTLTLKYLGRVET